MGGKVSAAFDPVLMTNIAVLDSVRITSLITRSGVELNCYLDGAQSPEDIDMDLRSPPNAIDSYEPPLNPLPPLVENVYDTAKYRHLRRGSSLPASASSEPRASTAPGAAPAAPPAPPPPPPPAEEAAQIIAQASMNEPSFMFTAANGGGGGVVPMSVPEAPSPDYADSGMPIFPPGSTPFAAPMSPGAVPLPDTPMPGGMFSPRGSSFIPPSSSMLFDVGSLQQMPPPGQYTPHPSSMQHMFPPGAIPPSIMSPPPHMINPGGMPPNFMSPSQRMGPGGVPMSIMSPPTALPMMPSLVGMVPSSVVSGTMSSPDLSPLDHGPPIHIDPDHPFTLTSPHSVFYKKKLYRSAAHLFYSLMFLDTRPDIAEEMRAVESPHQVRYHALRNDAYKLPDWERIQHEVLDEALYQKFAQHVELRAMLLETGNQMLVNQDFRDHEWGVGHDGHGQNLLGHSLMRVRQRLMRETGRRDLGL